MSYLKLIRPQIQNLAETVASVLEIDVAIADKNLARVVGTGKFYNRLDEYCSDDSLFAKVLETGKYIINLDKDGNCRFCSNADICKEFANMSYPITVDEEVIGVVSFASFDQNQTEIIKLRIQEYFNMLRETAWIVGQEVRNVRMTNKLHKDVADVNEIISCLNKGIIILNSDNNIIHINSKALGMLKLSISKDKVISKNIEDFIEGIEYEETSGDKVRFWRIQDEELRVMYNISKINMKNDGSALMLSFDYMDEIVNIAKCYESKRKISFDNIIGKSPAILKSINKSKIAAKTDSTILLTGDSGTGKELFARSIHNESPRRKEPFVVLNCGSIPENLIESELFGYERGAFTGANVSGKKGKIEQANKGTLFLDEIGDLPLHLQTRLLRVLQERTIDRVGGEKSININIRVISATHKNLIDLVEDGKFRLDLYYRLNVIPIELPRLKDRDEDIFLCSDFIIKNICEKMNLEIKILSDEVREAFKKYPWYGNIRELENVLEHGICFSTTKYIEMKDLPDYFLYNELSVLKSREQDVPYEGKTLEELKSDFEKKIIKEMIDVYGEGTEGKKKVAEELGIGLTTLYRKMNEDYSK